MIEILLAGNALIAIAVMLLSIGVQKLYKAQAAENAALRYELRALREDLRLLRMEARDLGASVMRVSA